MNDDEIKEVIVALLEDTEGIITADEIYKQLQDEVDPGRTQEQIRRLIRELVNEGSSLIGSSKHGFFKIRTKEDAEIAVNYLLSRVPKLQDRAGNIIDEWNSQNPDQAID